LLSDDAKPINQDRPGTLGGEDLPSVMKNDRWFSKTRPRMLTSIYPRQVVLPFQALFDQALSFIVFLDEL